MIQVRELEQRGNYVGNQWFATEAQAQTVRFHFHGQGSEFFRIWIVNLVLTILTLGIYSAWAKVRTKRYFYGNTELAGDRFDYLASPIAILKGRIIAVVFLVTYTLVSYFAATWSFILFIVLMLVMPYVVMRAIRFNAIMSSWRGVRFGFNGDCSMPTRPSYCGHYSAWLPLVWVCPMLGINRISTSTIITLMARPQRRLLLRPKIL